MYTMGASVEVFYVVCKHDKSKAAVCILMFEAVKRVVAEGLGIELFPFNPTWKPYSATEITAVRAVCRPAPVVSVHTGIRRWRPDALRQEVHLCSRLGASIHVVHRDTLGRDKTSDPPDYHRIADIAQMAKELGVAIALENGAAGFRVFRGSYWR